MSKPAIPTSSITATRISAVPRAGWPRAAVLAGLVLWFNPAPAARAAQSPETPRGPSYSDFRIISERNIFNPQRSARTSGQSERREPRRSSTPTDYVTLVGTMSYEKGWHAFFEGSRSDFRKVLRPGDSIADHRLAAIGLKEVVLTSGTNQFVLPVGKQLRRETEGEWRVAEAPERPITSYAASSSSSSSYSRSSSFTPASTPPPPPPVAAPPGGPEFDPAGPIPAPIGVVDPDTGVAVTAAGADSGTTNGVTPAPAGGSESEVLRRLMQRREEELNR